MFVHANQFDPNIQMSALYAAAKAEAQREAERTRKKLRNFASALAGEYDCADSVVRLSEGEAYRGQDNRQNQDGQRTQNEHSLSESVPNTVSYWA